MVSVLCSTFERRASDSAEVKILIVIVSQVLVAKGYWPVVVDIEVSALQEYWL